MLKINELMKQAARTIEDKIRSRVREAQAAEQEAKRFDWGQDPDIGD